MTELMIEDLQEALDNVSCFSKSQVFFAKDVINPIVSCDAESILIEFPEYKEGYDFDLQESEKTMIMCVYNKLSDIVSYDYEVDYV